MRATQRPNGPDAVTGTKGRRAMSSGGGTRATEAVHSKRRHVKESGHLGIGRTGAKGDGKGGTMHGSGIEGRDGRRKTERIARRRGPCDGRNNVWPCN